MCTLLRRAVDLFYLTAIHQQQYFTDLLHTATVAQPLWDPANNAPACASNDQCASGRCLVTNVTDPALGTKVRSCVSRTSASKPHTPPLTTDPPLPQKQVCCAWDVYMTMGADPAIQPQPAIPTVFVTMRDGDRLRQALLAADPPLVVSAYMRPRPAVNWSSILIWLLGVATVCASVQSALTCGGSGGGRATHRRSLPHSHPNPPHPTHQQTR